MWVFTVKVYTTRLYDYICFPFRWQKYKNRAVLIHNIESIHWNVHIISKYIYISVHIISKILLDNTPLTWQPLSKSFSELVQNDNGKQKGNLFYYKDMVKITPFKNYSMNSLSKVNLKSLPGHLINSSDQALWGESPSWPFMFPK